MIPDTLNLEQRAALAVVSMCGVADEDYDYVPYMHADLTARPAMLQHSPWDYGHSVGRLVDGIALARHMSGTSYGGEAEEKYRDLLLRLFKPDGLSYRRASAVNDEIANMHDQTHVLGALTVWHMLTGDSRARDAADRLCEAMKRISSKDRGFWYLPSVEYTEKGWPSRDALYMHTAADPAHTNGRMINPLIKYYEVSGNRDALELAENYAAQVVMHCGAYNPDGSFNSSMEFRNGHFHSRNVTLAAVTRYAKYAGNAFYLDWARRVYDWVLRQCTRFGWTPGGLSRNKAYLHETCTLTDIVETGILLAQSGWPEYWNDVERFVRNHLVESQLLRVDWVEESNDRSRDKPGERTFYRVGERMLGAFAGYGAPNDFVCEQGHRGGFRWDVQTCCLGSGTRGLFLAWSNAVTEQAGRVSVNLLVNRSTKWADVYSHLPYEGKVQVLLKQDLPELLVRVPDWAGYDLVETALAREGAAAQPCLHGWGYKEAHVTIGPLRRGDTVTVSFPVRRQRTQEKAVDLVYETEWCCDDVVGISPGGIHYPLYASRKVLDRAPMRKDDLRRNEREICW